MKSYVISDLHLGDGTARDDFQEDDWLLSLCDDISNLEDAELIIIGDFFEGWQCEFEDIVVAHREVITQIRLLSLDRKLILISGNHDKEMKKAIRALFGIPVFDTYQWHSIFFMHGHQFDPMCGKYKWIGKSLSKIGGFLEYVINRDIDKWFEQIAQKITGVGRHGDERKYAETAINFIKDRKNIDTIIIGHTHSLCREYKVGDKTYRNSGTAMKRNLLMLEV